MSKCKNNEEINDDLELEMSSGNVFTDIGFDDEEAANLLIRARLLSKLRDLIEETGMSQRAIAKQLSIQQPRVAEIMKLKIQYFSVDTLLKYLDRLGQNVELKFKKRKKQIA
jgi:predicted XRE-type DNA-binding protein